MRRFLSRFPDGGGQLDSINPATLSWQLLLDARSITAANLTGAFVNRWPDTSGNGRDATVQYAAGSGTTYLATGSPKGLPVVQCPNPVGFEQQLAGPLPVGGVDVSAGMTLYVYLVQDVIAADSGGLVVPTTLDCPNSQVVVNFTTAPGEVQLRAVAWLPLGANPGNQKAVGCNCGNPGSSPIAAASLTIASHTLTLVCNPPNDGTGVNTIYYDGNKIVTGTGWTQHPQSSYAINGVPAGNQGFVGKIGFIGFASSAHSNSTRIGVETYLRTHWG